MNNDGGTNIALCMILQSAFHPRNEDLGHHEAA
jgi:hypothetical protein